jgi:PAS domain S-box-containing protein
MQPDNSQDGAGAPEMQPESESSAATALPADHIISFIQANDSGVDEIWENEIVQAQLSQSRLVAILEETPDFVGIADVEGRLLFVNPAGRKIIGLEPAEALGSMKISDCHPDWAQRIISQEGIPTALENGFWSGETAALGQDGLDIPVSQVIIAHRNNRGRVEYLSTILRDITDRKRAEMIQVRLRRQAALRAAVNVALSERDASLSEILERCSEAMIWHLDVALTRIWLHNSEDRTMDPVAIYGTPENPEETEETKGTEGPAGQSEREPPASGTSNGFAAGWVAKTMQPYLTNDALNDQEISDQGWLREWLQIERITAFAAFPMIAGDTLVGVLAVFARHPLEDDTVGELTSLAGLIARGVEQRRIDEESLRQLALEREARASAEEASRLKDDFLAMISHDLRAPLTSIMGWVRMLRAGELDEATIERALQTIEKNVTTQAYLIGDLLDASRIATGKLQLDISPVDLLSVIETAVDTVRSLIEEKRLRLQMVLEPWVGPFNGDQERLKQVVWNLLTNAIKFTPPEGLIEVRLERLEDKALIIVSDTGQGISPEFLPHIFDQFRPADVLSTYQERHREGCKQGGLGLGLAIVKRLVEMHGGAIYPYSPGVGQGSDFMITLPLINTRQAGREAFRRYVQSGAGAERSSALTGLRVLVVDDEYDTREVLGAMLSRYGAETRAAESAPEAIRLLVEWEPDVLVSDIGMPGEDGYQLIAKVRALPVERGGAIPAIALTAYASGQDRQRALSNGFQTHLAKPIEPVELARVVARAAGRDEKAIV